MDDDDLTGDDVTEIGTDDPSGPDRLDFATAMVELERIVAELESDTLDVDLLTERVERAAHLVDWCRSRIDGTRLRVEEILERLE